MCARYGLARLRVLQRLIHVHVLSVNVTHSRSTTCQAESMNAPTDYELFDSHTAGPDFDVLEIVKSGKFIPNSNVREMKSKDFTMDYVRKTGQWQTRLWQLFTIWSVRGHWWGCRAVLPTGLRRMLLPVSSRDGRRHSYADVSSILVTSLHLRTAYAPPV